MKAAVMAGRRRQPDPLLIDRQESSTPTSRHSSVIVVEMTSPLTTRVPPLVEDATDELRRVRMGRTTETKGRVSNEVMTVVTTGYLDGTAHRVASTRSYFQEDDMAFDAVPAMIKDVTDFGRLTTATKALAVSMSEFGPDNPPSPAQLAVFVGGYRNLLEWRRRAREQMTRAEGEIDFVETLLTQIL